MPLMNKVTAKTVKNPVKFIDQAISILECLREEGLFYVDLKMENVLMDSSDRLYFADLGGLETLNSDVFPSGPLTFLQDVYYFDEKVGMGDLFFISFLTGKEIDFLLNQRDLAIKKYNVKKPWWCTYLLGPWKQEFTGNEKRYKYYIICVIQFFEMVHLYFQAIGRKIDENMQVFQRVWVQVTRRNPKAEQIIRTVSNIREIFEKTSGASVKSDEASSAKEEAASSAKEDAEGRSVKKIKTELRKLRL